MNSTVTKVVLPIEVHSKDIKLIEQSISRNDKNTKCFLQTTDGKLYEVYGTIIFKKITKI